MANVLRKLTRESSLLAPDFDSFRRQESAFILLNLFVLAALLLIHTLFSSHFGAPPHLLILVLAAGFLLNVVELTWVQSAKGLGAHAIVGLTWFTIAANMSIAFALASLSYKQDTQYFALLATPILQAAFRFPLGAMLAVLVAGTMLDFFWVWNYFRLHPPPQVSEYAEAGTISLIYATTGFLVWTLVSHVRSKQVDLERAKERLFTEEKLAAVGRLSTAIAHEIRNPVAMISSALTMARNDSLSSQERQEMFDIAGREASRLEHLTTEFLAYARPRPLSMLPADITECISYIADISGPHATERDVKIRVRAPDALRAKVDSGQLQQALLNLVKNAIEASTPGAIVSLHGKEESGLVRIDVENGNGPIPSDAVQHIFEPFFTTKPGGTGLGLAIARNIARGHGGDLLLSRNTADSVQFSISLPAYTGDSAPE